MIRNKYHVDKLKRPLLIGDQVAYTDYERGGIQIGYVVAYTPKQIRLSEYKLTLEYPTVRHPSGVVIIKRYNE